MLLHIKILSVHQSTKSLIATLAIHSLMADSLSSVEDRLKNMDDVVRYVMWELSSLSILLRRRLIRNLVKQNL